MGLLDTIKRVALNPEEGEDATVLTEEATVPKPAVVSQGHSTSVFRRGNAVVTPPSTPAPVFGTINRAFTPVASTASPDPDIAREITETLAQCQSRGIEELNQQLAALASVIPDETQRIRAAVATLPGLDIKTAVQERLAALDRYRDHYIAAVQQELVNEKSEGNQRINIIAQRIDALQGEMSELVEEQASIKTALASLDTDAQQAQSRLSATYTSFHNELSRLLSRLG